MLQLLSLYTNRMVTLGGVQGLESIFSNCRLGIKMILVQRHFQVDKAHRGAFERMSSRGLWPAMREMGMQMVAYGTWGFAGSGQVVVTHSVYADFDHWYATRRSLPGHSAGSKVGSFYEDPEIFGKFKHLMHTYAERESLVNYSEATPFLMDEGLSRPKVHYRLAGGPASELPPTFGRGSIVEQADFTYESNATAETSKDLLANYIWPDLESKGARVIGLGTNALKGDETFSTFVAYPSFREFVEYGRAPHQDVSNDVAQAWLQNNGLVKTVERRLLIIGTGYGETN